MTTQSITKYAKVFSLSIMVAFVSCKEDKVETKDTSMTTNNLLLQEWTGPYGGTPLSTK